MRLNRNLSAIGVSAITTAPVPPTIPVLTIGTVAMSVAGTSATVVFTPTTPGTDFELVIYATNNIFGGRRFVKNFYRLLGSETNPTTSPFDFYDLWIARFEADLVEDASIFVKAKLISRSTGFDGVPAVSSGVVAA